MLAMRGGYKKGGEETGTEGGGTDGWRIPVPFIKFLDPPLMVPHVFC